MRKKTEALSLAFFLAGGHRFNVKATQTTKLCTVHLLTVAGRFAVCRLGRSADGVQPDHYLHAGRGVGGVVEGGRRQDRRGGSTEGMERA